MDKIFIYNDEGCDTRGIQLLTAALRLFNYSIELVDSDTLCHENWENECGLLIIGGGRDQPYHDKLSLGATTKIRNFVYQGGSYFGICAGAYFGAATIAFDVGGPLEIIAQRDLSFFPGCAFGPSFGIYSYFDGRGKRAARLDLGYHLLHNGGCTFDDLALPQINVIARYEELPGSPPAIVEISYGTGIALLSGCHLEMSAFDLNGDDPYESPLIKPLLQSEERRLDLFKRVMARLINCRHAPFAPTI